MLVSRLSQRAENFRMVSPDDEIEHYEDDFEGFDTKLDSDIPLQISGDRIIPIYILRDNHTGEEFTSIGYCPDIYNKEQDCMLPAQITIFTYQLIPKGYKGGYDPIKSISKQTREDLVDWLMNLWEVHIDLDREDLDYCASELLKSKKPEVSPLRRKIAECERFYMPKNSMADFTYNYARILSEGANGSALDMFSEVYLTLNKFDLDTYDFSNGFSDLVCRRASNEELEIYSEAALKLIFSGEKLIDENDRFGGLNNACVLYVTRRKKTLEELQSICDNIVEMADRRHEELELEREEELLAFGREERNPFAYEGN